MKIVGATQKYPIYKFAAIITVALLLACVAVFGQTNPPQTDYKPSEVQMLRLQLAQEKAKNAELLLTQAQQQYQAAIGNLSSEGEKIKTENKWPPTVQLNFQTLAFSAPPKPPPTAQPTPPKQ